MKLSLIKAIALSTVLIVSLAGCGGAAPAPSAAPAPAPAPASSQEQAAPEATPEPAAESWKPEKPITLLVGNAAGGGADLFARQITKIITDNNLCETPVVVENKPGGSHSVAFSYLHEQTSNPYIIGIVSASYYTVPLSGNSPVHPDDFVPVAHFCKDPNMVIMPGNSPFNSMEEMIAYAKENPKKLKYAGSGNVSDDAIICAMINELAGVEIEYVPFEAGSDILAALLGGHVDMGAMGPSEATEHVTNGNLKPMAVSAFGRLENLPDVPTFEELGYDISQQQSRALVMEKSVPEEAVAYYSEVMRKVSETPEWKAYLEINGMVEMFMDYKEYKGYNQEILDNYQKYIDIIMANS